MPWERFPDGYLQPVHFQSFRWQTLGECVYGPLLGEDWYKIPAQECDRFVRSRWVRRLEQLLDRGWSRLQKGARFEVAKACCGIGHGGMNYNCRLSPICPFCWARQVVWPMTAWAAPFIGIEKMAILHNCSFGPVDDRTAIGRAVTALTQADGYSRLVGAACSVLVPYRKTVQRRTGAWTIVPILDRTNEFLTNEKAGAMNVVTEVSVRAVSVVLSKVASYPPTFLTGNIGTAIEALEADRHGRRCVYLRPF